MKESRRRESSGRWPLLVAAGLIVVFGLLFWRVRSDIKVFDAIEAWVLILALGIGMLAAYVAWDWDSVAGTAKAKGTRRTAGALLQVVFVAAILVSVNYFSNRNYRKWDLTEEQIFTLAPQSVDVARALDSDVEVLAFFKGGQAERETFRELMDLYLEASPRIKVRFIDPDADPVTTKSYNVGMAGTIVMESGGRRQTLSGMTEQDVTRGFIKLTRQSEKRVCFTNGHGEKDIDDAEGEGLANMRGELSGQGYQTGTVNIASAGGVDPKCNLLVIAGPTKEISAPEVDAIMAFVEKNAGGIFLLVDPQTPGQEALLRRFNVKARTDIVVDANPINQITGQNFLAPIAAAYGKHPIGEKMDNVQTIFPLARSLEEVKGSAETDSAVLTSPIVQTSKEAWGESNLKKGEQPRPDEGTDAMGPVTLMVAGHRVVKEPGSEPEEPKAEEDPATGEPGGKAPEAKTREVRFAVVGDSDFATNQYASYYGNGDLFLNTVNWTVGEEDLISIRPRKRGEKPINLPSESFTRFVGYGPTLLLPLLVAGLGISTWLRRRRL